jgi:hypothetical protein
LVTLIYKEWKQQIVNLLEKQSFINENNTPTTEVSFKLEIPVSFFDAMKNKALYIHRHTLYD